VHKDVALNQRIDQYSVGGPAPGQENPENIDKSFMRRGDIVLAAGLHRQYQ
jgi:hypothetical protein